MHRRLMWLFLAFVVAACASSDSDRLLEPVEAGSADYEFTIPAGTGELLRSGGDVQIIPAELDVRVGETIRIENLDDEGHYIGIFFVGAGEVVSQRFASAGEFVGNCTVHPSGEITLKVSD
jgi:hypothetical protein